MKIRHTNVPAAYLILFKDNKVLLLRRFNTGYEDGKYSMIAGHVDPGETFSQTIIREAKEEGGIILNPDMLEVAHVMHRDSGCDEQNERVDVFFVAKEWSGEIKNMEPSKCDDLTWFDLDDLPDNVIPYIKHVLESINNKKIYSEFGWEK